METTIKESIRKYSLAQSSPTGQPVFEMIQANGAFLKRAADFLVPHRKDYYMFVLVRKGDSRHWVDTSLYTLKNNTFYISSPWQVHVKEKSTPMQGVIVNFTDEFLSMDESNSLRDLPIISNPYNAHEFTISETDLVFIEDVLAKLWVEYQSNNAWRYSMLLSYVRILAIYTSRIYNEQYSAATHTKERQLLQQFKLLINEQFTELHQVADYAKLLHISAGYLNDTVKQQSGKTAIEHIHERITLEAQRKLFHTELSSKEIAYGLGFEDAAYFTRFFKRLTGQTPAIFRQATREMYH